MRRKRLRLLAALGGVGLVLALAGCAGTQPAEAVKTTTVEMPPSYRFDPVTIEIASGTTVTWHNGDNFTHSVSFSSGGLPYLDLKPGESGEATFGQPGEYSYICTYHAQDMQGKVIVTAP